MKHLNGTEKNRPTAAGKVVDLGGIWRLRAEFLDVGPERFQEVLNHADAGGTFGILRTSEHRRRHPNTFPCSEGSIPAAVPCDVIQPLLAAGLMEEPLIGTNAFRPFEKDVKRYLRKGKNQLIIRLTSGTEIRG